MEGCEDYSFLCSIELIFDRVWIGLVNNPSNYQTLLVGTLAFIGVLGTILASNFRMAVQLRHHRQVEQYKIDSELRQRRRAIRDALSAELSSISRFLGEEFVQARKYLDPEWQTLDEMRSQTSTPSIQVNDGGQYRFSLPDRNIIYRNLIGQISALNHTDIIEVIAAYDTYHRFESWIAEHSETRGANGEVFLFATHQVDVLIDAIDDTRGVLDVSISKLNEERAHE